MKQADNCINRKHRCYFLKESREESYTTPMPPFCKRHNRCVCDLESCDLAGNWQKQNEVWEKQAKIEFDGSK